MSNVQHYLAPKEQPVHVLDCTSAFQNLTDQEKLYAHHISQASWLGSLICLIQTSEESFPLFSILQKLFHEHSVEKLREAAEKKGVSQEDFSDFIQFVAAFYGNMGNYLSFGDTKILPRLPVEKFRAIVECSSKGLDKEFDQWKEKIYSSDEKVLGLGMNCSAYYSSNVTEEDVALVREYMQQEGISPYNTRLWKHGDKSYELKTASADVLPSKDAKFKDCTIQITYGDHSEHLKKTVHHLQEAIKYVANDNQRTMLEKYIASFSNGSIEDHKDSQRAWIKDIGPVVETNIGFIESYRDPQGERGEFEGFVAVVNKEMSAKFAKLVENATKYIPQLPWASEFEKDKFLRPDFTSLEVLTFASSGVPAGINIPNYDDIRQSEGFKNVSLGNVIASKSTDPIDFIQESDQELYNELDSKAFEVQVGIHELLGHGSGKLFQEDDKGEFNFPRDLKNPLTGEPISSWYKPGETWDSKFQAVASTMEECRAECCGLYLCTNTDLLSVFGFDGKEGEDIFYINWLIMVRAGLRALEFYTPETSKWGQAHMQARFAILQILLQAGEGLVQFEETDDDVVVVLDRSKILSVGHKAIGDFLHKLQIWKATADVTTATEYYKKLTSLSPADLKRREKVMAKKRPRRVFVQAHTEVKDGKVTLQNFEPTPEGLIQSFLARFTNEE